MSTEIKTAPVRRRRPAKTEKPLRPTLTEGGPGHSDRTPDGRFAKNNPGGPGNPHARHCARMLALLRASISDDDMVAIIRKLVEKARAGDVSAAKLLMSYQLGKPAPAPNPDEIDRDEWEHYQRDTINLEEVQQVLGSLPARVGNDIARTALPLMTQQRQEALASQLVQHLPSSRKVTAKTEVATEMEQPSAPIPNRYSSRAPDADPATRHPSPATSPATSDPAARHPSPATAAARSTINEAPPIANRKSRSKRRVEPPTQTSKHDKHDLAWKQRSRGRSTGGGPG
jgi:hypothetical protein